MFIDVAEQTQAQYRIMNMLNCRYAYDSFRTMDLRAKELEQAIKVHSLLLSLVHRELILFRFPQAVDSKP